jgi:hypothetical protein
MSQPGCRNNKTHNESNTDPNFISYHLPQQPQRASSPHDLKNLVWIGDLVVFRNLRRPLCENGTEGKQNKKK